MAGPRHRRQMKNGSAKWPALSPARTGPVSAQIAGVQACLHVRPRSSLQLPISLGVLACRDLQERCDVLIARDRVR